MGHRSQSGDLNQGLNIGLSPKSSLNNVLNHYQAKWLSIESDFASQKHLFYNLLERQSPRLFVHLLVHSPNMQQSGSSQSFEPRIPLVSHVGGRDPVLEPLPAQSVHQQEAESQLHIQTGSLGIMSLYLVLRIYFYVSTKSQSLETLFQQCWVQNCLFFSNPAAMEFYCCRTVAMKTNHTFLHLSSLPDSVH